MITLRKFLTRDMPLMAVECWYKGRAHHFKEYTGIDFPLSAFRYKNGAFEFLTDLTGFEERIPRELSVWIRKNPEKFRNTYTQMVEGAEYFRKLKNSEEDILTKLNKVCGYFTKGFIGVLIAHHLPDYHADFLSKGERLFEEKLVKEVIVWREAEGNIFYNEAVEATYYLLNEIAASKKWNLLDIRHLTLDELRGCLNGTPLPIQKIKERMNSGYYYFKDRVMFEIKGIKIQEETEKRTGQLKGITANRGKAEGRAKIIYNRQELKKVKKGDILISPMTCVWYVPAMEKAAAIVTDEGGITCHAAIIARELDKPCIIGTKYATQVFKDGDLVEVDANNGIVRKLNK